MDIYVLKWLERAGERQRYSEVAPFYLHHRRHRDRAVAFPRFFVVCFGLGVPNDGEYQQKAYSHQPCNPPLSL